MRFHCSPFSEYKLGGYWRRGVRVFMNSTSVVYQNNFCWSKVQKVKSAVCFREINYTHTEYAHTTFAETKKIICKFNQFAQCHHHTTSAYESVGKSSFLLIESKAGGVRSVPRGLVLPTYFFVSVLRLLLLLFGWLFVPVLRICCCCEYTTAELCALLPANIPEVKCTKGS